MIKLGDEVKCGVTGFKGIVTGVMEYLNGCRRILIQPRVGKDRKHPEGMWIDEPQILVVKRGKVKSTLATGGASTTTQRGKL